MWHSHAGDNVESHHGYIFLAQAFIQFLGGAAPGVTLSTIAAERFGSKIGGLIGGLPSTVIVTLFFIGLTQTPQVAASATTIIPLSMSLYRHVHGRLLVSPPGAAWAWGW